jgi:hypothetical protein
LETRLDEHQCDTRTDLPVDVQGRLQAQRQAINKKYKKLCRVATQEAQERSAGVARGEYKGILRKKSRWTRKLEGLPQKRSGGGNNDRVEEDGEGQGCDEIEVDGDSDDGDEDEDVDNDVEAAVTDEEPRDVFCVSRCHTHTPMI